MEIELMDGPHSLKEIRQLVKEENVFFIINTYRIIAELYAKAKKDMSELDPREFWKLKSLKKMYERSNDPEAFLMRMTHEHFIRIT